MHLHQFKICKIAETNSSKGFQRMEDIVKKNYGTQVGYTGNAKQKLRKQKMNASITMKEFNKKVLEGTQLSVVQFKTEWNGACEIIAPVYDDLANAYKHVANFFTIDADKEKKVSSLYCINETPAILFFQNGAVIDSVIGLISRNTLILKIENALSQNK